MNRRHAAIIVITLACSAAASCLAQVLPMGSAPAPVEFEHFPDRLHAFVWRNWETVSLERMAQVVQTTPENIRLIGVSMGLPEHVAPPHSYQQLGYLSIIRRNWHLLPYDQSLTLLQWDAEKLAFTLREDDFFWIKLGSLKPLCEPLRWTQPDEDALRKSAWIKTVVESNFKDLFETPARPRFEFFAGASHDAPTDPKPNSANEPIRFLYSYSGVFGDPLLEPQLDPYPDELLEALSARGVNGVWLHVVLRQLAPPTIFPEFGSDHRQRIAGLRRLVDRARAHGIKVYLYMNEPRAMPASFFEERQELRGMPEGDHYAMCTSAEPVRRWLTESLAYVFKSVPHLGGVFTITASENMTNCYSHGRTAASCPRCSQRTGPEVIAEVNHAIAEGVRRGNPDATVIVWDWGWPDGTASGWGSPDWATEIIQRLPDNVYLMSVSEWSKPINRGGVATAVGEYSISTVGPGPRAERHWQLARNRGLKTLAKVQVNSSWELSAVPFIPAMNNVARHCANLTQAGINGLMLSWTVGGYPSPNLDLVRLFQAENPPTVNEALTSVARSRYGDKAAGGVLDAWSAFSEAFSEYPFHGAFVYNGPAQCGPSNLLFARPTGYRATMVGFPYDDVNGWRGPYPAQVLAEQFEKIAAGWRDGLAAFEKAVNAADNPLYIAAAREDLGVAKAAGLHFKSVADQIRFNLARNALLSGTLDPQKQADAISALRTAAANELNAAKELFVLTRRDPRIGFEASNQYYYLPLDLVEKVVNCQYILGKWPDDHSSADQN